jgi:hypothetical protein
MSASAVRSGTLHLTKECSEYTGEAGAFCTIESSNLDAIPIGSKVVYAQAATAAGGLDSDIVVETPSGDTAKGHVVLDGATQTGTVTLAGGTGELANLEAELAVGPLDAPTYSWEGPYSY